MPHKIVQIFFLIGILRYNPKFREPVIWGFGLKSTKIYFVKIAQDDFKIQNKFYNTYVKVQWKIIYQKIELLNQFSFLTVSR